MAQMPEEGRKFGVVDSYWKDIMAEAVSCFLANQKRIPCSLPELLEVPLLISVLYR